MTRGTGGVHGTRLSLATVVACMLLAASLLPAETRGRGTVRSPIGAPLPGVWVQELGARDGAPTNTDGVFTFPLGKPVALLLAKDGFRPEIVRATGTERDNELNVVMRPEPDALSLPSCKGRGQPVLPELELAKSPRVQVKRGGEVDFIGYTATYHKNGRAPAMLESMTGIHVGAPAPLPHWVEGLSSLIVRSIRCGGVQWIDLRGVSNGGLRSRWVGYGQSYVAYSKVPTEAANIFDRAIDNGCCR
jgi:hypothetical protein